MTFGLIAPYLQNALFIIWIILAIYLLLTIINQINDRIREMIILSKLKKDKNFRKLYDFALKIKLKVILAINQESSGLAYSKTIKNFLGRKTEVLFKKPFIVLGVKYKKSAEVMAVYLSHEIGHRLYWIDQLDKYGTYLESPDLFCPIKNKRCELIEEIAGWKYAMKLLNNLGIVFDKEKFLKIASLSFGTYLLSSLDCLDHNCPKLHSILFNELTVKTLLLSPEEKIDVINYFNDTSKTLRLPDLGKIFND
ncbi:MAG: hypothetical protein M1334_04440 [Patescibacteria group bacterium]|nr:hypothetical protein [Patescibacteria group bacterium]